MNKNQQIGMAALPIIIGGVVVAGLLITAVWLSGEEAPIAPAPVVQTETAPPEPAKSRIIWGSINPGVYSRTVSAKASASEKVQIGGSGTTALKIESTNSKLAVSLKTPEGQVITAANAAAAGVVTSKITDPTTGKTAYVFQVKTDSTNTDTKEWEVVINNQSTNSPSTYDLTVSDTSLVNADPEDSNITASNQNNDQTATISITVTETVSVGVNVPVLNADVTAIITDPNGDTTTVDLTENPNDPGNYSGTFDDITTPGTYDVEYHISGTNSNGEPFDQIVNDQFTVPDPSATAPTGGSEVGTDKKYDINQSGEIQPVQ